MNLQRAIGERGSTFDKAVMVLEAIVLQPQSIGLPDLIERVGLPRETVRRVIFQLEDSGLIVRDPSRDRFAIGPRLSRLALASMISENQGSPIRLILQELVDHIQETCNVGVLDGLDFVYLERVECTYPLRIHLKVGSRVPGYCTAGGKAHLAYLSPQLRSQLLKNKKFEAFTKHTLTKSAEIERACEEIRIRGYAVNVDEFTPGITGVGVPIFDASGTVVAALATQGPSVRISLEKALDQVPKLQAAAKRLAKAWAIDRAPAEARINRSNGVKTSSHFAVQTQPLSK